MEVGTVISHFTGEEIKIQRVSDLPKDAQLVRGAGTRTRPSEAIVSGSTALPFAFRVEGKNRERAPLLKAARPRQAQGPCCGATGLQLWNLSGTSSIRKGKGQSRGEI